MMFVAVDVLIGEFSATLRDFLALSEWIGQGRRGN